MPPGTAWVVWLDVTLDSVRAVPAHLDHRLSLSILGRDGSVLAQTAVTVARIDTSTKSPVELLAPVQGGTWFMSEGCCADDTHHRRGLAAVDGTLLVPQRFAIDFYKLDDQNRAWVGDPSKLSSYFAYRQTVTASAAGTIVDVQDGVPNSTSLPKPPPIPPIDQTVGNHVIEQIADGVYVLYGHLDPESVKVRLGQHVTAGQALGLIGSSGNSTVPHLHFQIMTTPTFFPTDSRPFVFRQFELRGHVPERIWDDDLGLQPTGTLPVDPATPVTTRHDQLPLDRDIVRFG
ncbi:MAG: M23 family metallopeptidase [Actinobacteria bacterium]|nr:M23 family metallopeptidase [Actinomycetota bacterium]